MDEATARQRLPRRRDEADRPDTGDRHQPASHLVLAGPPCDLPVELSDPPVKLAQHLGHQLEDRPALPGSASSICSASLAR